MLENEKSIDGDGTRSDRGLALGMMVFFLVAAVLICGGLFWFGSYLMDGPAPAMCGGSLMDPGDQCVAVQSGLTTSYEEAASGERSARNTFGWIARIAGVIVGVVGLAMAYGCWVASRR